MKIDFSHSRAITLSNIEHTIARLERVNIERHRGDGDPMHQKAIAFLEELQMKRDTILAISEEEWQAHQKGKTMRGQPDSITKKTWQDAGSVGISVEENDQGMIEIYDQAGYSIPDKGVVVKPPEEAEAFVRNAIDHPWYPDK